MPGLVLGYKAPGGSQVGEETARETSQRQGSVPSGVTEVSAFGQYGVQARTPGLDQTVDPYLVRYS